MLFIPKYMGTVSLVFGMGSYQLCPVPFLGYLCSAETQMRTGP